MSPNGGRKVHFLAQRRMAGLVSLPVIGRYAGHFALRVIGICMIPLQSVAFIVRVHPGQTADFFRIRSALITVLRGGLRRNIRLLRLLSRRRDIHDPQVGQNAHADHRQQQTYRRPERRAAAFLW